VVQARPYKACAGAGSRHRPTGGARRSAVSRRGLRSGAGLTSNTGDSAQRGASWPDARMNRTIKDATVKVFHYDDLESLKAHVLAFVTAYNFAKHL